MALKNNTDFDAESYVKVNERLSNFRRDNPQGVITTFRVEAQNGGIVYKAVVCRNGQEVQLFGNTGLAAATGHAFLAKEDREDSKVEEFTETVAVGRALAMLGYQVEKSITSSEEMVKFEKSTKFQMASSEVPQSEKADTKDEDSTDVKLKTKTTFNSSRFAKK